MRRAHHSARAPIAAALCLMIAAVMVSCSSTSWLRDPYGGYDRGLYVCAVGHGATQEEADLAARRELASLFGMSIQSSVSRTYMESSVERDGRTSEGYGEVFESTASSTVDVDDLYGVEIAKRLGRDGLDHSLAVMERRTTAEYYRSRVSAASNRLASVEEAVKAGLGTMEALGDAAEYVRLCRECNVSTVMYNYLSGGSLPFVDVSKGYGLYDAAADAVVLEVEVSGDPSGAVASAVGKVLTGMGLAVSDGTEAPTAKVSVRIVWREQQGVGVADAFVFALYDADVSLVDEAGGEAVMVRSLSGKEGHQSLDAAKARAVSALSEDLEVLLERELADRFSYLD